GPLKAFAAKGKTVSDVMALLDQLRGPFFDPAVDAMVTQETPEQGRDILEASANNLYADVKMADLSSFEERHGPNSRLIRQNGTLVEEVYRVNGRYGELLSRVVNHLEAAL